MLPDIAEPPHIRLVARSAHRFNGSNRKRTYGAGRPVSSWRLGPARFGSYRKTHGWGRGCFRIYRPSSMPSFGLGRCDRRHKLLFEYPIIFWAPRGSLNHVERALGQSRQAVNLALGHFAYTRLAHAAACPGVCRVRSRATRWLRALKRI
jgi:hypothetical protein